MSRVQPHSLSCVLQSIINEAHTFGVFPKCAYAPRICLLHKAPRRCTLLRKHSPAAAIAAAVRCLRAAVCWLIDETPASRSCYQCSG